MSLTKKYIRTLFLLFFIGIFTSVGAMAQDNSEIDSGLMETYKKYRSLQEVEKKEQQLESMRQAYPADQTKGAEQIYKSVYADLAILWLKENNIDKYNTYGEKAGQSLLYRNLLGTIQNWSSEKKHLDLAKKYGKEVMEYYDDQEGRYSKFYHASAMETYGRVLQASGKPEEALKYYEKVSDFYEKNDQVGVDFINRYADLLAEVGHHGEAMNLLESILIKGKSNEKITGRLKEQYKQTRGNTDGYQAYLQAIEEVARQHAFTKVSDEKIENPEAASAFTLKNLKGEQVSLKELRGKVVIVDFWATWCGPCKASFPGMQLAVNKYKNDPGVKFLFVNTLENRTGSDTPEKDVQDFITKKEYTFNVLLDSDNSVVKDYGVRGIPTKFVIGKDGKIQFKSVGSNGIDNQVLNKVSAMIEMAKQAG